MNARRPNGHRLSVQRQPSSSEPTP
jgi:hypothetical protein